MADLKLDVTTPERVAIDLPIAGIGYRVLAYLVDVLALLGVSLVLYFGYSFIGPSAVELYQDAPRLLRVIALVAGFVWTELAFLQALAGARLPVAVQLLIVHLSATAATLWVGLPRSGLTAARAFPLRRIPLGLGGGIILTAPGLMPRCARCRIAAAGS